MVSASLEAAWQGQQQQQQQSGFLDISKVYLRLLRSNDNSQLHMCLLPNLWQIQTCWYVLSRCGTVALSQCLQYCIRCLSTFSANETGYYHNRLLYQAQAPCFSHD
jgi:hypothetical protein